MEEQKQRPILVGLLFAVIARIVFGILNALGVIATTIYILSTDWKDSNFKLGERYYKMALVEDQMSNVILSPMMNTLFIKNDIPLDCNGVRLRYGHQDDTISDITGRLLMVGGLTNHGIKFVKVLDAVLGKHHCILSVSERDADILKKGL